MRKILCYIATTLIILSLPCTVLADYESADNIITKEEQYSTTNSDEKYNFEESIIENGYNYKLISTNTEIIKTDNNAKSQIKQQEVTTSELPNQSYDFDETIETQWGGQKYTAKLVDVYYTQSSIEQKQIYAEGSVNYPNQTSEPSVANKEYFDVDNEYTGSKERVQLSLQKIDKTEETWSEDVSFPIVFSTYSASYYNFNGERVLHDDINCPLDGKSELVLDYLGLDKSKYKITSVKWDGDPDTKNDTRKAVAYGKRLTSSYTAYYADWVTITGGSTWIGHGVYEFEVSSSGKPVYTIKAIGVYQRGEAVTQTTTTTTTTTTVTTTSKIEASSVVERAKSAKVAKVPVAVEIGGTTGFVAIIVCICFVSLNSVVVYDMKGNRLFSRKCKRSIDLTKAYIDKHERVKIVLKSGARKKAKNLGGLVFMANGRQVQIIEKNDNGYIVKLKFMSED